MKILSRARDLTVSSALTKDTFNMAVLHATRKFMEVEATFPPLLLFIASKKKTVKTALHCILIMGHSQSLGHIARDIHGGKVMLATNYLQDYLLPYE